MSNDVGANGQSIVTKKSGGKVITGPDVCKTPTPGGPVPIPYPNISLSSDLAKGSKSVTINGVPACLKGSNFKKSTGDQAGSLGGVISSKTGAKAEPINYSFNVMIEGMGVVRNLDLFQSNNKNTPPGPVMQAPLVAGSSGGDAVEQEEPKCLYCQKPEHKFSSRWGNHIGDGQRLRKRIVAKIESHPWYAGPYSLQAHHVICSEAMDNDAWAEVALLFGYDINHKNNGVMLPYIMALSCQLQVPLHRGNHDKGVADGLSYSEKITQDLKELLESVESGQYCDNPRGLVEELDNYSRLVLKRIDKFSWTITADGRDYRKGGIGCAGATSIRSKPVQPCPHDRSHGIQRPNESAVMPAKDKPLEVGR